jgi:alpha/beta hydrolase fold
MLVHQARYLLADVGHVITATWTKGQLMITPTSARRFEAARAGMEPPPICTPNRLVQTEAWVLRGFNDSDKPEGVDQYQLRHLVEDVRGLLHHFGQKRAIVAGHDAGAFVAWAFAATHPGRDSMASRPSRRSSLRNLGSRCTRFRMVSLKSRVRGMAAALISPLVVLHSIVTYMAP